jgi:hypothetical protein
MKKQGSGVRGQGIVRDWVEAAFIPRVALADTFDRKPERLEKTKAFETVSSVL